MNTTTPYDKKTAYSVINLLLPAANDGFKTYSLEQLQELQSKLALISGKHSSGQEDVDKFGQVRLLVGLSKFTSVTGKLKCFRKQSILLLQGFHLITANYKFKECMHTLKVWLCKRCKR